MVKAIFFRKIVGSDVPPEALLRINIFSHTDSFAIYVV